MSHMSTEPGRKIWIKAGWASLIGGWLGYFVLMALLSRSPWMHTSSGILAIIILVAVLLFAFLGWRNREGGSVWLLVGLAATPVVWYFTAVMAMAVIADGA